MVTCISNSTGETELLGEKWADQLRPGWVVAISGDLGAGKTVLARGILKGCGYTGKVSSPTFALVNQYETRKGIVYHLDLYRLETPEQIIGAGLEQYLETPRGISIVEWASRWQWPNSQNCLRKVAMKCLSENAREISYEDFST